MMKKKTIKIIWTIISVMIIASMVLMTAAIGF